MLIQCVYLFLNQKDLKKTFSSEHHLFTLAETNSNTELFCQGGGRKQWTQQKPFPKQIFNSVELVKLEETSELASFETLSFEA